MEGVDFYIHGYQPISIGGVTVYITTSHVCLAIVLVVLIAFAIVANRVIKKADPTKAPSGFLNVLELLVETLDNLVHDNMGRILGPKFRNYIGVLFMLIITCNLSGLLFLPVNIISEFATPVSLSLRLFANILSGTMMMALIYGLLPSVVLLVWPAALHAYLDVFAGALQAYVFAMLTMVFIANAADIDD